MTALAIILILGGFLDIATMAQATDPTRREVFIEVFIAAELTVGLVLLILDQQGRRARE